MNNIIKAKLDSKKGKWAQKLPEVLSTYRTIVRTSIGEIPFAMAFGVKAIIPIETKI
ncbi:hypothetical protein ACOSQ4_021189 [Xanthoceras sorbifolium]